jgi:hypothetical protein
LYLSHPTIFKIRELRSRTAGFQTRDDDRQYSNRTTMGIANASRRIIYSNTENHSQRMRSVVVRVNSLLLARVSSSKARHQHRIQLWLASANASTPAIHAVAGSSAVEAIRTFSSSEARWGSTTNSSSDEDGPTGSLFNGQTLLIGPELVGATGMIQRTFGPRSNAEGLLAVGGAALAAHASFDPDYDRAQDWIRHHAVGPAVLTPILIAGLTGALTEAAFPHAVITAQSMRHHRPLIVGVPVQSMIQVISVAEATKHNTNTQTNALVVDKEEKEVDDDGSSGHKRKHGYNVVLRTVVTRVRDEAVIAEGTHELWVPDYLRM